MGHRRLDAHPAAPRALGERFSGLAELYAVGVVGAIATNLGACSTDRKLELRTWERSLMFVTFLIMALIEFSLFADKPAARVFAVTVLAIGLVMRSLAREQGQRSIFVLVLVMIVALFLEKNISAAVLAVTVTAAGLILRGLHVERSERKRVAAGAGGAMIASTVPLMSDSTAAGAVIAPGAATVARKADETVFPQGDPDLATAPPLLCAIRGIGKTLDFAIEEARESKRPLYLLFVREQPVMTSEDRKRKWRDDDEAREIFNYARSKANGVMILPGYAVSDSPADTIVDFAATVGASRLLLGAPARSGLINLLRGNIIRQVSTLLPEDIHLIVYA